MYKLWDELFGLNIREPCIILPVVGMSGEKSFLMQRTG